MKETINNIDLDIQRCEMVLQENNYLEIVIAIEELQDKYKENIASLNTTSQNVVWNYSKKDLENVQRTLRTYKEEIIKNEKEKSVQEKLRDLRKITSNEILLEALQDIENINNEEIDLNTKWSKLKVYLDIAQKQERNTGLKILEIISLIAG